MRRRSAGVQSFHLAVKRNLRFAEDARALHRFAQFPRLGEFLHPRRVVPLAPHQQIVRILGAAAGVKTFFAGRLAKLREGLDLAFPLGVIRDLVTNHDVGHAIPFSDWFFLNTQPQTNGEHAISEGDSDEIMS